MITWLHDTNNELIIDNVNDLKKLSRRNTMARGRNSRTSRRPHSHRHTHPHRGHAGAGQLPFPGGAGTLPQDCGDGSFQDCSGNCFSSYYLDYMGGDGMCNDGTGACNGPCLNLNCPEFDCDSGACGYVSDGGVCVPSGGGMKKGGRVRRQMGGGPKPWNR